MEMNEVPKLRQALLDIMDEIHRVCVENQIGYYIIGGTAIGAVRHHGFIPWDTDLDIAMKREDYNRFLSIAGSKLKKGFSCHHYGNTDEWFRPHAVVFKDTTMIHWSRERYKRIRECPIYVDIMPLDYVPADENSQQKQAAKIQKMRKLQKRRECNLFQWNSAPVCFVKRAISAVLRLQSDRRFNQKLDSVMSRYSGTKQICSMSSRYSYKKQRMDISVYGTPVAYLFEGREYFGPEKIHEYLTQLYGDYMQLPPEDKRTEYLDNIGTIDF